MCFGGRGAVGGATVGWGVLRMMRGWALDGILVLEVGMALKWGEEGAGTTSRLLVTGRYFNT